MFEEDVVFRAHRTWFEWTEGGVHLVVAWMAEVDVYVWDEVEADDYDLLNWEAAT